MSAAEVWTELQQAGASVGVDDEGLFVDAAPGVPLVPALLARVALVRPALVLVASEAWRGDLATWSEDWRVEWAERAAIREHDGAQPRELAGAQPRELAEAAAYLEMHERRVRAAARRASKRVIP